MVLHEGLSQSRSTWTSSSGARRTWGTMSAPSSTWVWISAWTPALHQVINRGLTSGILFREYCFGRENSLTLSFFSLVFWFPWCFSSCGFPWCFGVSPAYFTGILRVRRARKILDVFEGFPWFFKKTKEKKDRGSSLFRLGEFCEKLGEFAVTHKE